jgi:VanZ family protein
MPNDQMTRVRAGLPAWLLPIGWMGVILILSTDVGSAERTGGLLIPLLHWLLPWTTPLQLEALHFLARKAAHFIEYAMLAGLWLWVLARNQRPAPGITACLALTIGIGWAVLDEVHQLFVVTRGASVADVALDTAGAATAVALVQWGWRAVDATTTGLLWVAGAGGALALALNLYAGVSSGVLWVTVPAAVIALILRRRWRQARGPDGRAATP